VAGDSDRRDIGTTFIQPFGARGNSRDGAACLGFARRLG